jgi:S1-C subfamily serine protease
MALPAERGPGGQAAAKAVGSGPDAIVGHRSGEPAAARLDAAAPGRNQRALLGVVVSPAPDELNAALGLPPHVGLLVESLTYLSPAGLAGVRRGDVLVGWGGRELTGVRQLSELVAAEAPGAAVQVDVRRGRQSLSFRVELGETVATPLPPLADLHPTTGPATADRFIRQPVDGRPGDPDGPCRQ